MQIIKTTDGSHTIYLPDLNEQYHSVNGAITESNYVYLEKGYNFSELEKPNVLEIGFGTGLNCLLTAIKAEKQKRFTTYTTIEKFPLEKKITSQLNFGSLISENAQQLFNTMHDCSWEEFVSLSKYFRLKKIKGDISSYTFDGTEKYDVIYFDAFGPDKQPEMWTPQIFSKINSATSTNGIFVTYSAKGEVRRQLSASGFEMERLPGPPGKHQMLRGIKEGAMI
jgi:tRNA U34 5-methylaminomethyl-2-thiouridine-forming methyltransferase MnmC